MNFIATISIQSNLANYYFALAGSALYVNKCTILYGQDRLKQTHRNVIKKQAVKRFSSSAIQIEQNGCCWKVF